MVCQLQLNNTIEITNKLLMKVNIMTLISMENKYVTVTIKDVYSVQPSHHGIQFITMHT